MDNSLIEMIIKMLGSQNKSNQNVNTQQNPSVENYPKEAFSQVQSQPSSNDNNLLPILMSFLKSGDNPLLKAFPNTQSTKKEEDTKSSPNNEILL